MKREKSNWAPGVLKLGCPLVGSATSVSSLDPAPSRYSSRWPVLVVAIAISADFGCPRERAGTLCIRIVLFSFVLPTAPVTHGVPVAIRGTLHPPGIKAISYTQY